MKLNETDLTLIRVPIVIRDANGDPLPGYVPGVGELKTSRTAPAWSAAAGTLEEVGGGLYYYQGVLADASVEGFLGVMVARAGYEADIAWASVIGSSGVVVIPFTVYDGNGDLAPGVAPAGAELEMSLDGAPFVLATGTYSEIGSGAYFYTHDVANPSGFIGIKVAAAGYEPAIAWSDIDVAGASSGAGPVSYVAPDTTIAASDPLGGDLAVTWSNSTGDADLSLVDAINSTQAADLSTDQGLITAVALSLFTDRRAEDDDIPPSGDPNDRRGWWADQFADVEGDLFGSRLWLLARSKLTNETALRAEEYIREALAWMLEDLVVSGIDVAIERTSKALQFTVGLDRPGQDRISFRFAHTWDHQEGN